jgi:putative transposase
MPRQPRIVLANTPHHVIQRGHNCQAVFTSNEAFAYYRQNLIDLKEQFGCRIYAYCLMSNHAHLLIDPGNEPESLALLMKRLAGRQTRFLNRIEKRTGTLWEGRYKSSVVCTDEYLLACCRYIELNPVRAGLVKDPAKYPWSSYSCKVSTRNDPAVDLDFYYIALGKGLKKRRIAYQKYVLGSCPDEELQLIRQSIQRCQVTGSSLYRDTLSKKLGLLLSHKGPGRPKKQS